MLEALERPPLDPELWFLDTFCPHLGRPGADKAPLWGIYTARKMLPCTWAVPVASLSAQGHLAVPTEVGGLKKQGSKQNFRFCQFPRFAGQAGERRQGGEAG